MDNTPLSIDATAPIEDHGRPGVIRTIVRPPERNPEEEPMLVGATGRRGATLSLLYYYCRWYYFIVSSVQVRQLKTSY